VISRVLVETGLTLFAVDASPSLLREFHNHFPGVDGDSSSVEKSKFFGRTFDGVVAWGLLFLLDAEAQTTLLAKIAGALRPGGRLLFTAPREAADWTDLLTGELSHSLGVAEYERQLRALGLAVSSGITDEGGNHYYCATKPAQRQ
jgi:SAM-dependent methyltransferase